MKFKKLFFVFAVMIVTVVFVACSQTTKKDATTDADTEMVVESADDAKCGEGKESSDTTSKCGEGKEDADSTAKCGEGKCGA